MGHIKMSQKEIKRLPVIMKVVNNEISQKEASERLKISYRQLKRQVKRVRENGAEGVCHRNRGKPSSRKMSEETYKKIVGLCERDYADFGPTLAQEKLLERDQIKISRESLRHLLLKEGLWKRRKARNKTLHVWRQRRACEGELIQMDGSHHRWLEDRLDQEFCLMAYIDDATSTVYARFYEYEGIYPVFDSFKRLVQHYGRPERVYTDRHSTYKTTKKATIEDELEGRDSLTQFQRVMKLLEVEVIFAQTPQAKGRVERLFQTLQDRLVKEMRLVKISSIAGANQFLETFLPNYNKKFTVPARDVKSRWRPTEEAFDETWIFSVREERTVLKNYTIQFRNRLFQIKDPYLALQGQKVEILQSIEGELRFTTKHKRLEVEEISELEPMLKKNKKQSMATSSANLSKFIREEENSKKSWMDEVHFEENLTLQPSPTVESQSKELVLAS